MPFNNQDSAWKNILDVYFKSFLDYCLPALSTLIDWSKEIISLDKELRAISKKMAKGKRLVDKLFKVSLKNGKEQWVLIHTEIQGKPEDCFPERMFTYAYRSYDKYQKPIVSLAILTDKQRDWRPNSFKIGMMGSYIGSEYVVIKIIDYKERQTELELSTNPFASVILAQLAALESNAKPHTQRKEIKLRLTRGLYEKGFSKEAVHNLYEFIDWLIGLPEELEVQYLNDVYEFEESTKMAYVSNAERMGIKKGREEGMQIGIQQGIEQGIEQGTIHQAKKIAFKMLKEGFDESMIIKITGLNRAEVNHLQEEVTDKNIEG